MKSAVFELSLMKLVPYIENNRMNGIVEKKNPIKVIRLGAKVSGKNSTILVATGL